MADTRRTEIGSETVVNGNIDAQEDVAIHGHVEGTVKSTTTVIIEDDGEVYGEIEAANVVIAGVLVGNIRATGKVEVEETGVVQGDICTPVMVLVDGGAIKGQLIMDDSKPEPVKVNTTGAPHRPTASRVSVTATRPSAGRTGTRPAASTTRPSTVTQRPQVTSRPRTSDVQDSRLRKPAKSSAPLIDDVDEGQEPQE